MYGGFPSVCLFEQQSLPLLLCPLVIELNEREGLCCSLATGTTSRLKCIAWARQELWSNVQRLPSTHIADVNSFPCLIKIEANRLRGRITAVSSSPEHVTSPVLFRHHSTMLFLKCWQNELKLQKVSSVVLQGSKPGLHFLFLATAGLTTAVFVGWLISFHVFTLNRQTCKQIKTVTRLFAP